MITETVIVLTIALHTAQVEEFQKPEEFHRPHSSRSLTKRRHIEVELNCGLLCSFTVRRHLLHTKLSPSNQKRNFQS